MPEFVKVANFDELKPGECKPVSVLGRSLAIYNVGGRFYATKNTCPHQTGPLGEGHLDGETITCPWHGWKFNVISGNSLTHPGLQLRTYQVKIGKEAIEVKI